MDLTNQADFLAVGWLGKSKPEFFMAERNPSRASRVAWDARPTKIALAYVLCSVLGSMVVKDKISGARAVGTTMGRKKPRVRYQLDSGDVRNLACDEIKAILRAADEVIASSGRSMLAKILKGSKDQKVLKYGLEQCPVYGYYRDLTLKEN